MTDKEQIIIDGVDVSECLFYQSNFEEDYDVKIKHFCSNWHNSCESVNNSNCYFKQLARKTQECEELKEEYTELKLENKELYRILAGLKEVRKLKDRYRKALDEIEQELKEDIYCESQECGCDDFEKCLRCTKDQILNIINKVKDGNNE